MAAPGVACEPVFVKVASLPPEQFDTVDFCTACEITSGKDTMMGAQRIRGLWRLYPKTRQARDKLLIQGIELGGVQVTLMDKNPFTFNGSEDTPTTKLWLSGVPLSARDDDLVVAIEKLGCVLQSQMKKELARDKSGKLTQWLTGRRFVFIDVPKTPLSKSIKVGIFNVDLYHKEQRATTVVCNKCLKPGHRATTCEGPVVCKKCHKEGHKAMECGFFDATMEAEEEREERKEGASEEEEAEAEREKKIPPPSPLPARHLKTKEKSKRQREADSAGDSPPKKTGGLLQFLRGTGTAASRRRLNKEDEGEEEGGLT
jgi:hypothetical protein